ncbi:MAG: SDR family NAD(P)-dependent oxidoreductase [Saprospiraceae bacterium]|nr:SDR family NAD(P)-dependent oxidoreductase [Lewinella sp.]
MQLTNQTILITGGTSGIGYELGQSLLAKNNKIILLGRNRQKLEQAAALGFETIVCDLGRIEEVEAAAVRIQNDFPDISVLFNNAGVQYNYLFTEEVVAPQKIHQEIQINISGQILLTQLLLPLLSTAEKAMVVNTTSGLGAFPKADGLVYSATKAAMRNFTVGLRYALRDTAVRVLEFIPPVTDTGMTSGRETKKMPVSQLISSILPQLEKERKIVTVPAMRMFLWIAFLFPGLANRILAGK